MPLNEAQEELKCMMHFKKYIDSINISESMIKNDMDLIKKGLNEFK